jgi:hypothetical protein
MENDMMSRTHALIHSMAEHGHMPRPLTTVAMALSLALALVGCRQKAANSNAGEVAKAIDVSAGSGTRVSACALLPIQEINEITGDKYATAKSEDDGRAPQSSCHYEAPGNPAAASIEVHWLTSKDYSNPAEHAAMQKAAMGGGRAAAQITGGMGEGHGSGMASGPVDSVGDEAMINLMLLTARKGDYTITVQIIPINMSAILTDSTVAIALVAKEKAIARRVLAKV